MAAPLVAASIISKSDDILNTDAVKGVVSDARGVAFTETGRKGLLNTISDAVDTAANASQKLMETGSDLTGRYLFNYTSPKTKQDRAIMAAVLEYKKAINSAENNAAAEGKYWESIEKSTQDRRNPVNVDINKAAETLNLMKIRSGGNHTTKEGAVLSRSDGKRIKYGGVMAECTVSTADYSGGSNTAESGALSYKGGHDGIIKKYITTAIMILTIILLISIIYIALMSSGSITNKDQTIAKNTIIGSGVIIIILGIYKVLYL